MPRRSTGAPQPAAVADGRAVSVTLRYRPPYDWTSMLAFLRGRAIAGVEIVRGETYARTIDVDGCRGTVEVAPTRAHALSVTVRGVKASSLPVIEGRLVRLFDVAADPRPIAAHLSKDSLLAPLVEARPGLRVPGAWDGFELAVRAVLGQQISVPAAISLAGRLVAQHGEPIGPLAAHVEGLTTLFPTPERLASVPPGALPMPRQRATALVGLAQAVADDPFLFRAGRSLRDAVSDLRGLAGIGEWTAQYIAMRTLREPDAFPPGDVGLARALSSATGRRPTAAALLRRAERWRPWRAYAAQHLWTADAQPR